MANFHNRKQGLVSVVMATYNYSHYICEALDSLKKQTYPHIEVVIIDDGSTDATEEVVKEWYKENRNHFKNFIYWKLPRNCGQPWALNIGFYISQGEYIVIHDADDISHEEKIEKQVRVLNKNTDTAAVGTRFKVFVNDIKHVIYVADWLSYNPEEIEKNYKNGLIHCVCFGTLMFRASILEDIIGCTNASDVFFIYAIVQRDFIIDNIDEILHYVRSHPERNEDSFQERRAKWLEEFKSVDGRVSMVIPIKGAEKTLINLLENIALQTYPDIEVILVDESADEEAKTIAQNWYTQYKKKDKEGSIQKLIYFSLPVEIEYPWSYNIGAYLSKGEYIVFHGSEGKSAEDKIKKQVDFLEENPMHTVVGTNFTGDGPAIQYDEAIEYSYIMDYIPSVNIETIMMRNDVINKTAGMNQGIHGLEDFEFIYRLINNGYRIQNLREVLYHQS